MAGGGRRWWLNLRTQVMNILAPDNGGTGNPNGWGSAVVEQCANITGSTIARGSVVELVLAGYDSRIQLAQDEDSEVVLGVVVGRFDASGRYFADEDVADAELAAVMTAGICNVLLDEDSVRGEYAVMGTNPGLAKSDASSSFAFGIWLATIATADADSAPCQLLGKAGLSTNGGGSAVTFGTPNFSLGTSNTAGSTDEVVRRDAGIAIFNDGANPTDVTFGGSAATGNDAFSARRDHEHGLSASPPAGTTAKGLYGDGYDGDFDLDGSNSYDNSIMTKSGSTYTLARNVHAQEFEVQSGSILITAGYVLFVRGSLTNDGTIRWNGNNAGSGGINNAGSALAGQTVGNSRAGGAGSTTDANGTNGTATDTNGSGGGPGGSGGNSGTGRTGGVGGGARSDTNGSVAAPSQGGLWGAATRGKPFNAVGQVLGLASFGTPGMTLWAGGAGGGGGAKGTVAGAGGGGGGGGGVVVINAATIVNNGTIEANGGTGATATTGSTSAGGGGGGGGLIGIMSDSYTNNGTVQCLGGAGGAPAGGGSATAGGDGGPGNVVIVLNV